MSWTILKEWSNRKQVKRERLPTTNGRTWTRRIQWLTGDIGVKLKFDDSGTYDEVVTSELNATTIWQRFTDGQSIQDSISILAREVPASLQSKKKSQQTRDN